jgi:Aerobic-type carbon monoxide dehydrogenase, middle subunit CoxM/CutM homologs
VTPFDLVEPASLKEAIALIDPDDPDVRPIAGGTALMLMMKAGVFRPRRLVSLRKLGDDFSRIAATPAGDLRIGAMTPLSVLEHSPDVLRHASVVVHTMRRLANVRVRNVATVGGALAHADPHMDLPPVLIALGASVSVVGTSGERTMPVEDLLTGYYETALAKNELITEVRIPAQGATHAVYFKVTTGSADDWPALGVAVALVAEGSSVKSARIVVSAATTKATRLQAAEKALIGLKVDDAILKKVADTAADEADVLADVRGSASYKRELLRVYVVRAVRAAMQANGVPH